MPPKRMGLQCGDSPQQQVGGDEDEENYGDNSIHGKEGGVELAQIIFRNQGMLVSEQSANDGDTQDCKFAQAKNPNQSAEQA